MRRLLLMLVAAVCCLGASCPPPTPVEEGRRGGKTYTEPVISFRDMEEIRSRQLRSAAYLIDLRIDDAGKKFSVTTELYLTGDSVGFYGRSYLGKGAFKGHIINDTVLIYFQSENQFLRSRRTDIYDLDSCLQPAEFLFHLIPRLAGRVTEEDMIFVAQDSARLTFRRGMMERTIVLETDRFLYPDYETFLLPSCGDSLLINYGSYSREVPFYRPLDFVYYNAAFDFRARGFIREQKYNIDLDRNKFQVAIPPDADAISTL
jgi:hypothetical protein